MSYWKPPYLREEYAGKKNPRTRGGKKKPTLRHLWQKYEHLRGELWTQIVREIEYEKRTGHSMRFGGWSIIDWRWREANKLELEIQKLEAEKK